METAPEHWHRPEGCMKNLEQHHASTKAMATIFSPKWKENKAYISASFCDPHFQGRNLSFDI